VADTIVATAAYATLVTGATIGAGLADIYKFGTAGNASLGSTSENIVAGTSAAAISGSGILSFTGKVTSTGSTFAAEVLTFLAAHSINDGKVTAYDDGVNQWLFSSTAGVGRYIELINSHDALFAGASTTKAAHTILLG